MASSTKNMNEEPLTPEDLKPKVVVLENGTTVVKYPNGMPPVKG